MYPNLFKKLTDLPKLYNDVPKPSDVAAQAEGGEKKSSDKIQDQKEEKYPELSVKMFFDFMRTAYQVNSTFEDMASTLSANSEIDWNALAKTSLDFGLSDESSQDGNNESSKPGKADKNLQTASLKESATLPVISEAKGPIAKNECQLARDEESKREKEEEGEKEGENQRGTLCKNRPKSSILAPAQDSSGVDGGNGKKQKEPLLSTVMKRCLSDVLHEGILDSVIPYMVPKTVLSQPMIRKPQAVVDPKRSASLSVIRDNYSKATAAPPNASATLKDKDKGKSKKYSDVEVEIHVCDEAKNIKRDFRCPQKLLVQKMCYFAEVTAGQKLEEMDISVHCDIVIFDWLMRWVKKDLIKKSEWPTLEPGNVVPIMVSASFLQMEPLLQNCLTYCHDNMSEVLRTSAVLTCLSDGLLTRLADLYSNAEVEAVKDKKDKIQSRLFCKLIMALADPRPDPRRGHFGSLATLFRCAKCEKNVVRSVSDLVPCAPSNVRIDAKGNLHSKHTRDMSWSLNDYIVALRTELRSWRKVYWRLWGDCHFLFCKQCGIYFPINQMDWCSYHPENPQYFVNEQQRTTPFPLGRFPCCSQRSFRFQAIANRDGCKFREHVPNIATETDESIVNVFLTYREVISIETPQLFFPEKITRLVARDPALPPGKLSCKETFWWEGIEILPSRPKLGLLAKIWGGSGIRKPCQTSSHKTKKVRRQASQITDASVASSESCSNDDEDEASASNSSLDEDSDSEESNDWDPGDCLIKKKFNKSKILKRCEGMGSWSSNLSIRYNQDNQRDFEEKAAAQMTELLTKRTMLKQNVRPKSHSLAKHSLWNSNAQPIGGTYVRLEAEFLNQFAQTNKCKSAMPTKGSTRIKSSK